jgi:hypothetical protein
MTLADRIEKAYCEYVQSPAKRLDESSCPLHVAAAGLASVASRIEAFYRNDEWEFHGWNWSYDY